MDLLSLVRGSLLFLNMCPNPLTHPTHFLYLIPRLAVDQGQGAGDCSFLVPLPAPRHGGGQGKLSDGLHGRPLSLESA